MSDADLHLLRRVVATPSVTGSEAEVARVLAEECRALALETVVEEFLPGRPNVRAVRRGSGGGPRLLIVGHTDTVHARGWRERWLGTEREDPFAGPVVDGALWGRGAADLKAGLCCALAALRRLAGTPLAGDVLLAFVGDEESGESGSGVSAGMRKLAADLDSGVMPRPDFAIYVEPTRLAIYPAQMGFLICDILVRGRSAYFGVPELGADALKAAHAVLAELWAHSARLEARGTHRLIGRSFLLVTGIAGGGSIAVPGEVRLSLICKLRPEESLDEARAAIEAAARSAPLGSDISLSFSYPAGRDHPLGGLPCQTDPAHPAVARLAAALARHHPGGGSIEGAPFWSEASFLTVRGIPCVYCAPGDIRVCHTLEERVPVAEYRAGIAAFADFIGDFCGNIEQGRSP